MRAIEEIIDPGHISVKRSRHDVEDPHQPVYSLAVVPRQRLAALPVPMHGGFRNDSSLDARAAKEAAKGRHGTQRQPGGDSSGEGDFVDMFSLVQVQQPSQAARLGRGYAGWIGVGFKRIYLRVLPLAFHMMVNLAIM